MLIKMSAIAGGKTGKIGKINVKVGDKIAVGDILAQVETGKGNKSVTAISEGVVCKILCEEGSEIESNEDMFEIAEDINYSESNETFTESINHESYKEVITDLLVVGAGPGGFVAAIYAA